MAVTSGHLGNITWTGFVDASSVVTEWNLSLDAEVLSWFALDGGTTKFEQSVPGPYRGAGTLVGVMDASADFQPATALVGVTAAATLTLVFNTTHSYAGSAIISNVSPRTLGNGQQGFSCAFRYSGAITVA